MTHITAAARPIRKDIPARTVKIRASIRNPPPRCVPYAVLPRLLPLPLRLHEVMLLRRDVEGGDALADALVLVADGAGLLEDVHIEGDVDLPAGLLQGLDVLAGLDAVDGRAEAGAEELVFEVLADD